MLTRLLTYLTLKGYKVTNHVTTSNVQDGLVILDTVTRKCSIELLF